MAKPNFKVSVDLTGVKKTFSAENLEKAQELFAERVAFDTNQYCPRDEGTLHDSQPISSDYKKGQLIWDTPYAQERYNADSVRDVLNPDAHPHWAEYAKSQHLDSWKKFASLAIRHTSEKTPEQPKWKRK